MNPIDYSVFLTESGCMCLILDTNRYSDFLNPQNQDMEPVRQWMRKKSGKIAFAHTEKLYRELKNHHKMHIRFQEDRANGRVKLFDAQEVEEMKANLPELKSNDPDIIALAKVSNVKLLVSADSDLHADFKSIVKGRVYQTRHHRHFLQRDACP